MDGRWFIHASGNQLTPSNCKLVESMPGRLTPSDLPVVVKALDCCITCPGNHDADYCELAKSQKGVFKDSSSKVVKGKLHLSPFLLSDGTCCHSTVRTEECDILTNREVTMCSHCKAYWPILRSLCRKRKRKVDSTTEPSVKTNWRYLSPPEKKGRYQGCVTEVGFLTHCGKSSCVHSIQCTVCMIVHLHVYIHMWLCFVFHCGACTCIMHMHAPSFSVGIV